MEARIIGDLRAWLRQRRSATTATAPAQSLTDSPKIIPEVQGCLMCFLGDLQLTYTTPVVLAAEFAPDGGAR